MEEQCHHNEKSFRDLCKIVYISRYMVHCISHHFHETGHVGETFVPSWHLDLVRETGEIDVVLFIYMARRLAWYFTHDVSGRRVTQ